MNSKTNTLLSLGLLALGASLNAQGGFVLFGDSGTEIAPEQKAVRPISAPYFHEDSFVTTDLRAWYVSHQFDGDTQALLGKGDVTVAALQVRLALTESLQLVAYKDGHTEFDGAGALNNNDGLNDIGAGLKWAFYQNWEEQLHFAAGIGYEFGWGDDEVLQDTDELRLWLSWNKGFDALHLGATVNYIASMDSDKDAVGDAIPIFTGAAVGVSDMITVHFHADYYLTDWFSPVVELNGYLARDSNATIAAVNGSDVSGVDAVSLPGGKNEPTWTYALGFEVRPLGEDFGIRVAYEDQLNGTSSLFGDRWTLSAVYEF